jgi:AcrR family transcriptional regulator
MITKAYGNRRRRGEVLTESIYQATVEALKEDGYANLTFQKIAQKTRTSRTVLYRRWETPLALIHEILVHKMHQALNGELIDNIIDTGSLRGDLLHLLTLYQRFNVEVGPEIVNAVLFEMSQNNANVPLFSRNATEKNILAMGKVVALAQARGEKIRNLSPRALALPFDLIRMDNLLYRATIDAKHLEQLVDEILLPVFLEPEES